MDEKRLQYEFILWFGQTYPNYRRLLFLVNNDARTARVELGMITGVSDLVFCIPNTAEFCGIELKVAETRHKVNHLRNQLSWGDLIIKNGGYYIMADNLDDIKTFITELLPNGNIERSIKLMHACNNSVKEKLKGVKTKTVKL